MAFPTNLPEGTPLWAVTLLVIVFMIGTFSKSMQEVKGPLGSLARWWGAKQLREVEKHGDMASAIDKQVRERVERYAREVDARMTRLEAALDDEREARRRDMKELQELRDYAVAAARREFALKQFAAANGLELPPPPLPPFHEWVKSRKPPQ